MGLKLEQLEGRIEGNWRGILEHFRGFNWVLLGTALSEFIKSRAVRIETDGDGSSKGECKAMLIGITE